LCEPNKNIPGGDHRPSCTATIYSDDHGKTWKPGEIIVNNGDLAAKTNDTIVNPNESVAIELADGRVMMNMRNESLLNRRLISYSKDGISNWSKPIFDDELFEPVCMSSLVRVTGNNKGRTRILFVNPDSRNNAISLRPNMKVYKPRENLTAKLSYDEGETWPVQKVLHDKGAGYSDIAVDNNGTMYCLCEVRESSDNVWKYKMIIRRFNLEWLTDNKDSIKK
jgi:sialidase-1